MGALCVIKTARLTQKGAQLRISMNQTLRWLVLLNPNDGFLYSTPAGEHWQTLETLAHFALQENAEARRRPVHIKYQVTIDFFFRCIARSHF